MGQEPESVGDGDQQTEVEIRLPSVSMLSPRQQQYVALRSQGKKDTECASLLGIDTRTIRYWRDKPLVQYFLNEVTKEVNQRIRDLKPRAVQKLSTLLQSEDERVALQVCLAVLKPDLEHRDEGRFSIVEDTITELEAYTNRDERIELAKRVRAYLDARRASAKDHESTEPPVIPAE